MAKCTGCKRKITLKNDGLIVYREHLSTEQLAKLDLFKKDLCTSCKKEMLYAGILEII